MDAKISVFVGIPKFFSTKMQGIPKFYKRKPFKIPKCLLLHRTKIEQQEKSGKGDVEVDGAYLYIPLYMVSCL
jgi:hypothetical protein